MLSRLARCGGDISLPPFLHRQVGFSICAKSLEQPKENLPVYQHLMNSISRLQDEYDLVHASYVLDRTVSRTELDDFVKLEIKQLNGLLMPNILQQFVHYLRISRVAKEIISSILHQYSSADKLSLLSRALPHSTTALFYLKLPTSGKKESYGLDVQWYRGQCHRVYKLTANSADQIQDHTGNRLGKLQLSTRRLHEMIHSLIRLARWSPDSSDSVKVSRLTLQRDDAQWCFFFFYSCKKRSPEVINPIHRLIFWFGHCS